MLLLPSEDPSRSLPAHSTQHTSTFTVPVRVNNGKRTANQQRRTNPSATAPKMPSKVSIRNLSKAQQNRIIQKQAARAERGDRDRIRFPDDATRRNKLRNEYRRRKKEPARLGRLRDEAAIPENEKNFWAQYRAACDESQPSKAEIKALLKTRGHMDIWPEVEFILSAHRSWIESELRG